MQLKYPFNNPMIPYQALQMLNTMHEQIQDLSEGSGSGGAQAGVATGNALLNVGFASYATAFEVGVTPIVTATVFDGASGAGTRSVNITASDRTGFSFEVYDDAGNNVSGSSTIHWMASAPTQ